MRDRDEIMGEIIDISMKYERLNKEIRAKSLEMDDFRAHVESLIRERDSAASRLAELQRELQGVV